MRIDLKLILLLLAFAGSLFGIYASSKELAIVWTKSPLTFRTPETPRTYLDKTGPVTGLAISNPPIRYENGKELYLDNHIWGWERCRESFYQNDDWQKNPFSVSDKFAPQQNWKYDHMKYAASLGYDDCMASIRTLLESRNELELRQQLVKRQPRSIAPSLLLLLISFFLIVYRVENGNLTIE